MKRFHKLGIHTRIGLRRPGQQNENKHGKSETTHPSKVSSDNACRKYMFLTADSLLALVLLAGTSPAGTPEDFAGDEFQVNSWVTNDQRVPTLAARGDGEMVSVWHSTNQAGSGLSLFGQRLDKAGGFLGAEFGVNEQTAGRQDSPDAVFLDGGGFIVVWTGPVTDSGPPGIWSRRFGPDGQPTGGDELIYHDPQHRPQLPRLSSDGTQTLLVVWEGQDDFPGSTIDIVGLWLDLAGNPLGEPFVVNQFTESAQRYPHVAMSAHGRAVATWASSGQDGDSWGVFARCLDGPTGPMGPEFQVNQFTTGAQHQPRVAVGTGGRFAITWWDDTGLRLTQDFYRRVQARTYGADCQPRGDEVQVNQFDAGVQDVPAIAADETGYLVAWQSYPEIGFSRQGIYARRMDVSGNFIGEEFRLSQETEAYQDHPAITTTPDSGLFGIWETLGQDGSGFGIYARLFHGPRPASIERTGGGGQSAMPGDAFDEPLTVRVTDQWGQPMTGAELRFSVPWNGPTVFFPNGLSEYVVTTDDEGFAGTPLVAGTEPGNLEILVRADENGASAVFSLTIQGTALSPPIPVPLFGPAGPWLLVVLILGLVARAARWPPERSHRLG